MSYERGLQAINLQMPDKVPHTEYVTHPRWVRKVTGLDPDNPEQAAQAGVRFCEALDYDLMWINYSPPDQKRLTHMGTAHWYEDMVITDNRDYRFKNEEEVLAFDPVKEFGVPDVSDLARLYQEYHDRDQATYPFAVCPGGFYNTIFSWCILTFGWEMFLSAAVRDPERFDKILEGFFEISLASYRAQARTTIKAFISHDDIVWTAGAVFHPNWYRKYVFPRHRKLWAPLKEKGIKLLFCSDGNFTEFIDDLVEAGADGFIFEPTTDLAYMASRYGQTHVIIGNIDCRILAHGTREQIEAEVKRCADIGRNCPGYFFAVGNHIPHDVPIENADYYVELINRYGCR
jgi:hypothetical protein